LLISADSSSLLVPSSLPQQSAERRTRSGASLIFASLLLTVVSFFFLWQLYIRQYFEPDVLMTSQRGKQTRILITGHSEVRSTS